LTKVKYNEKIKLLPYLKIGATKLVQKYEFLCCHEFLTRGRISFYKSPDKSGCRQRKYFSLYQREKRASASRGIKKQ
jgi:hypothetical protein